MSKEYNSTSYNIYNSLNYSVFSDKTVLLLAPHEDDEVNISGDLLYTLKSLNCRIYLVYVTNGDYFKNVAGKIRINEAIKAATVLGIASDNVIFLGYGDRWNCQYGHIYNAPDNEAICSHINNTYTYGTDKHPDYHYIKYGTHALYTYNNYKQDIKDVITDISPDIIFTIDFDTHPDHIALSLIFDKIMGELIKELCIKPFILKAFAYNTSFYAPRDYQTLNSLSTKHIADNVSKYYGEDYVFPMYNWSDRLRLITNPLSLTANIRSSLIYKVLSKHHSQPDARYFAGRIINSDKVFWERRCDSLLYDCMVTVSSGNKSFLNDFMIVNSDDISQFETNIDVTNINNCLWIPDSEDMQKTCTFTFLNPVKLNQIVFYENPSLNHNINCLTITFNNTESIVLTDIIHNGTRNLVSFDIKENIHTLSFTINDFTGELAGISEIEAYLTVDNTVNSSFSKPIITKLTSNNNFIYTYLFTHKCTNTSYIPLEIYTYPALHLSHTNDYYDLISDNNSVVITHIEDNKYTVSGLYSNCNITLKNKTNSQVLDVITIKRISPIKKISIMLQKKSESMLWFLHRVNDKITK